MTDADPIPVPQNPALPANWRGGTFEGHLAPLHDDWYAETRTEPERVAEMTTWAPLEDVAEADPPGAWGFDVASAGPGGGAAPRPVEVLTGVIKVVSRTGTGLVLEEYEGWLNTSRYGPPLDLAPYGAGDVVAVEVEAGRDGRRYLRSVRRLEAPGA